MQRFLILASTLFLPLAVGCGDDTDTTSPGTGGHAQGGSAQGGSAEGGGAQGGSGEGGSAGGGGSMGVFTVSVTVDGLLTEGLAVTLDGNETLTVDDEGTHTFTSTLADGASYEVTATGPHGEGCVVANATGTIDGTNIEDVTVTCTPVVAAQYEAAPGWNEYLTPDGTAACNESAPYADCIHGGEHLFVYVPGLSDCTNVTASDTLGAFRWTCDDTEAPVRMLAHALDPALGLRDLLDFSMPAWRDNSVTVDQGGTSVFSTAAATWWPNPVMSGDAGGELDTASAIYAVSADPGVAIDLNAHAAALVTAPGVSLTATASAAVVLVSENDFVWLEVDVDANGILNGIHLDTSRHAAIRHSHVQRGDRGILLDASEGALIMGTTVHAAAGDGIVIDASNDVSLRDVAAWNNRERGLHISGSDRAQVGSIVAAHNDLGVELTAGSSNRLSDIRAFANLTDGLRIAGTQARVAGASAHNNAQSGVVVSGMQHVIVAVTATNNESYGLLFDGASDSHLGGAMAQNNALAGMAFDGATGIDAVDLVATDGLVGIQLNASSSVVFTGAVKLGDNTIDCVNSASTGLSAACAVEGASTATVSTGIDASGAFAGAYGSDSVNTHASGSVAFASLTDWVRFQSPHRGWGVDGNVYPDASNRGACGAGDTCRIFGWQLRTDDTIARDIHVVPTGDDVGTVGGETFLLHAVEDIGDGIGDDDLLCESGETCMLAPNAAAYQGQGDAIAETFTDGQITGVTLWRHASNGVVIL